MRRLRLLCMVVGLLVITPLLGVGSSTLRAAPFSPISSPARANLVSSLPTSVTGSSGGPGWIEGVLYEPDGATPVGGGWVDVEDVNGDPWPGSGTAGNGSFLIPDLPPGEYYITAYPPDFRYLAASLTTYVVVSSNTGSQVDLLLTTVSVGGIVKDATTHEGIPGFVIAVHDAEWNVSSWDTTDDGGYFKIGALEDGVTYILDATPPPDSPYPTPDPILVTPPITNVIIPLFVPMPSVFGEVRDPAGAPVSEAEVKLYNDDYWEMVYTDQTGQFGFPSVPAGQYEIQASPPWYANGQTPSEPLAVTVTDPEQGVDVGTLTLLAANKQVVGHVRLTEDGSPIGDGIVWANRLDHPGQASTPTNPDGSFTLLLTGGEWHVGVHPAGPGAGWIFNDEPEWVQFADDHEPEEEIVDLDVISADGRVFGIVVCADGGAGCTPPAPETISVSLRNDEIHVGGPINTNYQFELGAPSGWYEFKVHVDDPLFYSGPPISVYLEADQPVDLGAVPIFERDAIISGRVVSEFGEGVPDVVVAGWRGQGEGQAWTMTDANGFYDLPVFPGEWFVWVETQQTPYILVNQPPVQVMIAPGEIVEGVHFVLTYADARLDGVAVDSSTGEPIQGLDGWTVAERLVTGGDPEPISEAPMENGVFRLKALGGDSYMARVYVPPSAAYLSGEAGPVAVEPGEQVTVFVPLDPKNATIEGQVVDGVTGDPVPNLFVDIFGDDGQGHWAHANVDPDSATYNMGVVAGTWSLRAWVDPHSGYVAPHEPTEVTVASGETVAQAFTLWPLDSTISGQIFDPDGAPLPRAFVHVEGESPYVGYFEIHLLSREDGTFDLPVPEGTYRVGAALPPEELEARGWLTPPNLKDVAVAADSPATGLALTFERRDATIQGTISFAAGSAITPTHEAYVWAWSDDGHWSEAEATFEGTTATYTLSVGSGTDWHVGVAYDDSDNGQFFLSDEVTVPALGTGESVEQNLELLGPYDMPQPIILTFDATSSQSLTLPDGFSMDIPSGALAQEGSVTLYIFPTYQLRPGEGHQFISYGYNLWATDESGEEITQFNDNVILTFPYDDSTLPPGLPEDQIIPVYYSTLLGEWILADSYVLDTGGNLVALQVSHFSKFGTAIIATTPQVPSPIYLPLTIK